MANFKHKEYYRVIGDDSSAITFDSVDDAKAEINFSSVWTTGSPTIEDALADGDKTLVRTITFADEAAQKTWMDAFDADNDARFHPRVHFFKIQWLDEDGAVEEETDFPGH